MLYNCAHHHTELGSNNQYYVFQFVGILIQTKRMFQIFSWRLLGILCRFSRASPTVGMNWQIYTKLGRYVRTISTNSKYTLSYINMLFFSFFAINQIAYVHKNILSIYALKANLSVTITRVFHLRPFGARFFILSKHGWNYI